MRFVARSVAAAVLLSLASAGCSRNHVLFEWQPERFAESATELETTGSLAPSEATLLQAALAHALADGPLFDPARSLARLDELSAAFPNTRYAPLVELLRPLLRHVERIRVDLEREITGADQLRGQLDELRLLMAHSESDRSTVEARASLYADEVARLEAELRRRDQRIRELEEQLRALKEIDLSAGSASSTPPRR